MRSCGSAERRARYPRRVPRTLVLDYGNARSQRLCRALVAAGIDAQVTGSTEDVRAADRLVLPDGADDDTTLSRGVRRAYFDAVNQHIARKRPLLAVGFGLQFLLGGTTHGAMPEGLDVFRVPVNRFDVRMVDENERPLKSPHVGFTYVVGLDRHEAMTHLVPEGDAGLWFYFRHRLCSPARVPFSNVAVAHHGVPFAGAIWRDHVFAVQFLPEMSGRIGIEFLRAWDASAPAKQRAA